jgi:uncharacterized protein YfkK (UPF0435 family)
LAGLDAEISKLFDSAKKSISDKEKQDFIVDQRRWLKQRDIACNLKKYTSIPAQALEEKKTCLKSLYHARINDLKTSSVDDWGAALNELARRIQTTPLKMINESVLDTSNLGFAKSYDDEFISNKDLLQLIKKRYVLTKSQITEIANFTKSPSGVKLYLEDVDQDGIKDVIVNTTGGTLICNRYLYYHANSDKTLTRIKGPDTSQYESEGALCYTTSLGFVQLNNETYIAVVDDNLNKSPEIEPKTIIELFSLKSKSGRKGIGKIQINYSSHFAGKLLKGDNPAFHVLEEKADALVRHFSQKDSSPLATSIMNNPAWTYKGKDVKKIIELISEEYGAEYFLKNESQCQFLDIDNDGKKEIVCQMVAKPEDTKYNRMIIVKISTSRPISYIDVDKYYPELKSLDHKLFKEFCSIFYDLELKGSEYFPLSDGKNNYIVKIGKGWNGNSESHGDILGIYKLKGDKIEMVDAMSIDPELTFKDVTVLK